VVLPLRRQAGLLLVLLVAAALGLGCSLVPGQGSSQSREVRFGAGAVWPMWPFHMATYRDAFNQAGLKVTFQQMTTPPQVIEAMVAGSLDAGAAPVSSYATALEKGAKIKAVALLTGTGHPPNTFFVRKAANIKSWADLHGKTMAVNNYGGNYDLSLRYMLAKAGLDPSAERIVEVPDSATMQALTSGQVDLGIVSSSLAKQIENTQGDQVEVFARQTDIDIFRERINGLMLVMNDSFIRDHRDTARAFIGVLAENANWTNQNPREALTAFSEMTKNPAVLSQDKPNDFPDGLHLDLPSMQGELDMANQFGYVKTRFQAQDIVDQSLLDEYLQGKR